MRNLLDITDSREPGKIFELNDSSLILADSGRFREKIEALIRGGLNNLAFLADYDATISDGSSPALNACLRKMNILGDEYSRKAQELFDKYIKAERSEKMSLSKKRKKMTTWTEKHLQLFIESGLSMTHLKEILDSGAIDLREQATDTIVRIDASGVPFIVVSASGVGYDAIKMFLEEQNIQLENGDIVSNRIKWQNEVAVDRKGKRIVHPYNKDLVIRKHKRIQRLVEGRPNIITLGDGLGDPAMADGVESDNELHVGFLNGNADKVRLEAYLAIYDILIVGDSGNEGDFGVVQEVLNLIERG